MDLGKETPYKLFQDLNNFIDGCFIVDRRVFFLDANLAYCSITGFSRDELLTMSLPDLEPRESRGELLEHFQRVDRLGKARFETAHRRKDGGVAEVEISAAVLAGDNERSVLGFVRDITGRKETERRTGAGSFLLELFKKKTNRKEYLDSVVEAVRTWSGCRCSGIRVLNEEGDIPYESFVGYSEEFTRAENWLSLKRDQCACVRVIAENPLPQDTSRMTQAGSFYSNNMGGYMGELSEQERANFRGSCVKCGFSSLAVFPIRHHGKVLGAIHLVDEREGMVTPKVVDLIETVIPLVGEAINRFNVEMKLQRNYDLQTVLNSLLQLSLEDIRLEELLRRALAIILSIPWLAFEARGGIFLVEDGNLVIKAQNGFPEQVQRECARLAFDRCLCGRAAATREIQFAAGLDHRHEIMYEGLVPHGHYIVPIVSSDKALGVINIYLKEGYRSNQRDIEFLTAIANTLAGIILRKRTEDAAERSSQNLRKTLKETVNALARTAEKRDPYTAGHSQRVARLACAIAREMDLPGEQVEGINVAGTLHDIGKIYIPAEILNKPGRLTDIEMALIKTHPQVGNDIIKAIPFTCPVAEIVFQHQERVDGSGYPLGLSGADILLEAKILAVADVVEAIASHRPYRPALGLEKALEEIAKNSGVLYDPGVVAACLKLFRIKGFSLEIARELKNTGQD